MDKTVAKYVKGELAETTTQKAIGGSLVKTGAATGGLMLVSALPFITLPMLVVLMVIFGGYLYIKD